MTTFWFPPESASTSSFVRSSGSAAVDVSRREAVLATAPREQRGKSRADRQRHVLRDRETATAIQVPILRDVLRCGSQCSGWAPEAHPPAVERHLRRRRAIETDRTRATSYDPRQRAARPTISPDRPRTKCRGRHDRQAVHVEDTSPILRRSWETGDTERPTYSARDRGRERAGWSVTMWRPSRRTSRVTQLEHFFEAVAHEQDGHAAVAVCRTMAKSRSTFVRRQGSGGSSRTSTRASTESAFAIFITAGRHR